MSNNLILILILIMKRFLYGFLFGGVTAIVGYSSLHTINPNTGLPHQDHEIVTSYIHHHKIEKMLKQSIMNGYMQFNKAFLDYGLREKIEGFYFYNVYFNKDQIANEKIRNAYCIFSPKEQLCGHPNIQHGGATATIVDQNSGTLAMLFSYELVATSELKIKYLKPVKKGQVYAWSGKVTSRNGRKILVESTLQELQTGTICVKSEAQFMTVKWEHKMGDLFHLLFPKKQDQIV